MQNNRNHSEDDCSRSETCFSQDETYRRIMDEDYYCLLMRGASEAAGSRETSRSKESGRNKDTAGSKGKAGGGDAESSESVRAEISALEKAQIINRNRSHFQSGLGENIVAYYDRIRRKHKVTCIVAFAVVLALIELTAFNMADGGKLASEIVDEVWLFMFGS